MLPTPLPTPNSDWNVLAASTSAAGVFGSFVDLLFHRILRLVDGASLGGLAGGGLEWELVDFYCVEENFGVFKFVC